MYIFHCTAKALAVLKRLKRINQWEKMTSKNVPKTTFFFFVYGSLIVFDFNKTVARAEKCMYSKGLSYRIFYIILKEWEKRGRIRKGGGGGVR